MISSADNGSEFADLSNLETVSDTLVYYTHPYTSCEKGSVERHNGLIRSFIPKGKWIDQFDVQAVIDVETWIKAFQESFWATRHRINYSKKNWIKSIKQMLYSQCPTCYCNLDYLFIPKIIFYSSLLIFYCICIIIIPLHCLSKYLI